MPLALFNSDGVRADRQMPFHRIDRREGILRNRLWLVVAYCVVVCILDCRYGNGAITMLYVLAPVLALGSDYPRTLVQAGILSVSLTAVGILASYSNSRHITTDEIIQRTSAIIGVVLMCWVGRRLSRTVETLEQLRVEIRLRQVADEAASFFQIMVEHVPVGISQTDTSGQIVFVNSAFCRLWEVSSDDVLGKKTSDVVIDSLHDRTRDDEATVARLGTRLERLEQISQPDSDLFLKVVRTPIRDAHGRLIGVQSIWLDVSELKHAEQRLETYAENLERSNIDLKQFAYVASHDLQEPLRAVSGYCQLLEKQYSEVLDVRGLRWLQFVVKGAQRMQALVQDLLIYARIDNLADDWSMVSSQSACLKAVANLQPRLKEAGATILVGDLPKVVAETTQLELLFQNLIGNAVKFRRADVPSEVYVSARRIKEGWRFAVRDNGIGIKPEFQDRVFDIFKRLHSQDEYPGTGIGLAISKRIVERYGGRIWVRSQFGSGSTFYFVLPIPRRPQASDRWLGEHPTDVVIDVPPQPVPATNLS